MKRLTIKLSLAAMLFTTLPVHADDLFTGDVKSACEAVLCLSTGQRPKECASRIKRYFSIKMRKISDTLKARKNFLNLCPAATQDEKMANLIDAITNGAGRCDYAALNSSLMVWYGKVGEFNYYIKNTLPSYCAAYTNNAYTNIKQAVYVGTPKNGGHWIEATN